MSSEQFGERKESYEQKKYETEFKNKSYVERELSQWIELGWSPRDIAARRTQRQVEKGWG
jgi:hypothetical protein